MSTFQNARLVAFLLKNTFNQPTDNDNVFDRKEVLVEGNKFCELLWIM